MAPTISPFLESGPRTKPGSLAIVHLSRDILQPIYLQKSEGEHDGYAEGVVLNTRFGSFPHSTLLDVPWGSQIRASKVDTGSRGRKRKRNIQDEGDQGVSTPGESGEGTSTPTRNPGKVVKEAETAKSGFIHILPPTPEIWTMSLPHRTQVVYTPDYSYILQKIRARPGSRLIEAGAGSGSFTHAAARAVYNGYPFPEGGGKKGGVFSFEFNEDRFQKMTVELGKHELGDIVKLSHRDVYQDGFLVDGASPEAEAIFLDLPAPWRALPHLSRRRPKDTQDPENNEGENGVTAKDWVSPLNPKKSVYICTFSPCIEQVTRTVSAMRRLGWVEIEMVEIANRRIQVCREKVGLNMPAVRGMYQSPRDVAEAMGRLKHIEERFREHNKRLWQGLDTSGMDVDVDEDDDATERNVDRDKQPNCAADSRDSQKPWVQGQLVTRSEAELKTHTSYLVFAVMPLEWTEEDEAAAAERWPCGEESGVIGSLGREARKEEKRKMLQGKESKGKGKVAPAREDAFAQN